MSSRCRGSVLLALALSAVWACSCSSSDSAAPGERAGNAGAGNAGAPTEAGQAGTPVANGGAGRGGASARGGTGPGGEAGTDLVGGAPSSEAGADADGGASGASASPKTYTLTLGAETAVADYAARSALGFKFGFVDGVMGAVNDSGSYTFYGSAHSNASCAGTPNVQGGYRFGSSPTSITTSFGCTALIQNDADGTTETLGGTIGAFDRDYVGGGPVLRVTSADDTKHGILMTYHAEFHWGVTCGSAPCFYGTLGLAFSTDDGATFSTLGEIIQPHRSRPEVVADGNKDLSIGAGPFVEGDEAGHPIPDRTTADPAHTYLYVFFPDEDYDQGTVLPKACRAQACLAVARALEADVVAAAFAQNKSAISGLFHKFYNGAFGEKGASGDPNDAVQSGHYTPVIPTPAFSPTVMYDAFMHQYIMAHSENGGTASTIALRTSSVVTAWSDIVSTAALDLPATDEVRYPSLIGETGNPFIGGAHPWLFYAQEPINGTWPETTFKNRALQISAD